MRHSRSPCERGRRWRCEHMAVRVNERWVCRMRACNMLSVYMVGVYMMGCVYGRGSHKSAVDPLEVLKLCAHNGSVSGALPRRTIFAYVCVVHCGIPPVGAPKAFEPPPRPPLSQGPLALSPAALRPLGKWKPAPPPPSRTREDRNRHVEGGRGRGSWCLTRPFSFLDRAPDCALACFGSVPPSRPLLGHGAGLS